MTSTFILDYCTTLIRFDSVASVQLDDEEIIGEQEQAKCCRGRRIRRDGNIDIEPAHCAVSCCFTTKPRREEALELRDGGEETSRQT